MKKHKSAIEYFNKALEYNKKNFFAFNGLGSVFKELDDDDQAALNYKEAIKIKPDYLIAYDNLGSSLSAQDKLIEAKQVFDKMLELDPNYKYLLGRLVYTKMHLSDWNNFNNNNSDLIRLLNEDKRAINPFAILGLIDSPEHHKKCSEIFVSDKFKDKELGIKKYPKKKTEKI